MPRFWVPRGVDNPLRYGDQDSPDRRSFVYKTIDREGLQKWVIFVAGVGFFTDAYDIFSLAVVIPMIGYVYWDGSIPHSYNTALVCSSLAGIILGQAIFGVLGDLYGRRKMYGLELLVCMAATLGVAMSARGEYGSMEIVGWLIFWRFTMGIAIGADYPLSAVITAEFAPRKHRARMLSMVFWMQPIGQLLAIIVSLAAVEISKSWIPMDAATCSQSADVAQCARTIDRMWRWVVGLGAVPAIIAVAFRFTIPESPRYTMDISGETEVAVHETAAYFTRNWSISTEEVLEQGGMLERDSNGQNQGSHTLETMPTGPYRIPHSEVDPLEVSQIGQRGSVAAVTSMGLSRSESNSSRIPASNRIKTGHVTTTTAQISALDQPPTRSWADARQFFIAEGNWRHLVGTSLSWFLLDFAFYGLGLSSSTIVRDIWYSDPGHRPQSVYKSLIDNITHTLVVVSIGSIVGGAIFIKVIYYLSPKTFQKWGFIALAALLLITGSAFKQLLGPGLVVLYVLCQLAFNIGPNPTTYIIPAEIFPTRYRCSCQGIAAACGKLGSLIAQLFLAYAKFDGQSYSKSASTWLGHVLQVFSAFMAFGALVTWFMVPETRDKNGKSRSLEVLALGRQRLRALNGEPAEEDGT